MKKIPLFIQHDSMQCGIACLCMICKFFGRSISIETMANLCHANKEGVSLMGLSESATILGFHAIAARTISISYKLFLFLAFCIGIKIILSFYIE